MSDDNKPDWEFITFIACLALVVCTIAICVTVYNVLKPG